jgi:hypothetical protein
LLLLLAARLTLRGKGTLHFGRYRNNAGLGKGVLLTGSFDSESCYVTVGFALPRVRRYDFLAQISALFCAGLASIIAVMAALRSPTNDTVVIAGASHPIPPLPTSATSLGLAASPSETSDHGTRATLHLERAGAGAGIVTSVTLRSEQGRVTEGGTISGGSAFYADSQTICCPLDLSLLRNKGRS